MIVRSAVVFAMAAALVAAQDPRPPIPPFPTDPETAFDFLDRPDACYQFILNGGFESVGAENLPEFWIDGSDPDLCQFISNDGTGSTPLREGGTIGFISDPIDGNLDAVAVPTKSPGLDAVCNFYQTFDIDIGDRNVVYAQANWVDILSNSLNFFDEDLSNAIFQLCIQGDGTDPIALYDAFSQDISAQTAIQRVWTFEITDDVASFVSPEGMLTMSFRGDVITPLAPLYVQLDNVEVWVCLDRPLDDTPDVNGDPHFATWKGEKYSYHGACDLVLLHSEDFEGGLGLDVHIRTKHKKTFSFVETAALRIGDEVMEVSGHHQVLLNGMETTDFPLKIGKHTVEHHQINEHHHNYIVHLEHKQRIVIRSWKEFMSVQVENGNAVDFGDATGLMGNFVNGHKLSRHGEIMEDWNEFGQEWMVQPHEPKLFAEWRPHTDVCALPTAPKLRSSLVDEAKALKACAHVPEATRELCVFDVLATNDAGIAGTY